MILKKMANKSEKYKIVLDKVNFFKEEYESKRKTRLQNVSVDDMVVNLGNPRLAEKIRIHKVCSVLHVLYLILYLNFS